MPEKRRKTATLNLRISPEIKELAEQAAAADQRSLTNLVESLLVDHIRKIGLLPNKG